MKNESVFRMKIGAKNSFYTISHRTTKKPVGLLKAQAGRPICLLPGHAGFISGKPTARTRHILIRCGETKGLRILEIPAKNRGAYQLKKC